MEVCIEDVAVFLYNEYQMEKIGVAYVRTCSEKNRN